MRPSLKLLFSDPAHLIAMGFGAGLSPVMPGTVGSLLGVAVFLGVRDLTWPAYLVLTACVTFVGILAAQRSARLLGSKDPGCIVIDEVAGMLLTLFLLPAGWGWLLVGFVLFRLFDIFKPWPVSFADRHVPGGFGIMLDDLFAGIYALAAVQALNYLVPYFV